ncbi:phosphoglycerate mutase-like protein [Polychaeton citri CBS 116435]|uniref:Phosphoglycerate mutase-like protein n=1 Tax=Polychaeton citri CBS 116435 TaxID=1314669 RepID=A0A9P4Q6B1_9PEZI|nr:phosphoglycerate mutase-like protein [Polychaeton citri CBS 116435]
MGPTIHCVRHAEGFHNLCVENHQLKDPKLTPAGEEQCHQLQETFPSPKDIDIIVASPLKRTLYTALIGFEPVLRKKGIKIIALPDLQETSDLPCDCGSTVEELKREFANKPIDFSLLEPDWNSKQGRWSTDKAAITGRARQARCWLRDRSEKNIVVVTHGGFLHFLTEDWTGSDLYPGTGWRNTEFRSYGISSGEPTQAHLVETTESRQRRQGKEKSLDANEKAQLERTVSQEEREIIRVQRAAVISERIRDNRRDDIGAFC